jgi:hypothetical protein
VELAAAVRGFQVAVVNDVVFHHEVTLGVVSALQKHQDRLLVSWAAVSPCAGAGAAVGAAALGAAEACPMHSPVLH